MKYKYQTSFTFLGKRYYVKANTLKELSDKVDKKKFELEHSPDALNDYTTVDEWAYRCVDTYKRNQRERTRRNYTSTMRSAVLSMIGDRPIRSIRPIDCQTVLNAQEGRSISQINAVYQTIKFLFSHAYENDLIAEDPSRNLVKPAGHKGRRRALTLNERRVVLKIARTDRRYYAYLLMLQCGCRPTEATECRGRDIILMDGYHMLHIRGTKTALSDRYVPIPDDLYQLIKGTRKLDPIAMNRAGNPVTNQKRLWNSFKRAMNIEMGCKLYRNKLLPPYPVAPDLVPYCFRHEFCTELARQGIDIRIAQKLMGHASIKTTGNIYTHVDNSILVQAAKALCASSE